MASGWSTPPIAAAASSVQPPAHTASRRNSCSLGGCQQVVAPGDRLAQAAVAVGHVARATRQDAACRPRAAPAAPSATARASARRPARAPAANSPAARRSPARRTDRLARCAGERGRALQEQLDGGRFGERRHGEQPLALNGQRRSTGDQDAQARCRGEQLGHLRRGVEHMLEVVEHEQDIPPSQVAGERLDRQRRTPLAQVQGAHDTGYDQAGIAHGRQRDDGDAVAEPRRQQLGRGQREPRLPDAARAR